MKNARRNLLLFTALAAFAMPWAAQAQFVTGLQGAQGSTVGPDGALYVTEGAVGRVTRIDPVTGATSTYAEGFPPSVIGIGGAVDIAFLDGTAYVLVTLVDDPSFPTGATNGLYRVDGPSDLEIIVDLGAYNMAHPPATAFFLATGVLYALEPFRGGFLITDGHLNRVLWVGKQGEISEFKAFGNIVPTGLEVHGHTVYMNEAGPVPHHPEDGKVMAIDAKTGGVTEVAAGAPLLVDVEFGLGQTLYALSQGHWSGMFGGDGSPADPLTGSLVKVNPDGSFSVLATALDIPTSMELIGNTAYVVTFFGEVWKIPGVSPPPYGRSR